MQNFLFYKMEQKSENVQKLSYVILMLSHRNTEKGHH